MRAGGQTDATSIMNDAGGLIESRVKELLDGHQAPTGLLNRAFGMFVAG
jgi:hypothetical protein